MNRKRIEAIILKGIGEIDKSGLNTSMYENLFKSMNDKEFKVWVDKIGGDFKISIVEPIDSKKIKFNMNKLKSICKKRGIELYERCVVEESGIKVLTEVKYNIALMSVRRASQHGTSKINVAKDNKTRNVLTNQVTGGSKAASLSQPEAQILAGYGLHNILRELGSTRAGDAGAMTAFESMLLENGEVTNEELDPFAKGTQGFDTLRSYFKGMYLDLSK